MTQVMTYGSLGTQLQTWMERVGDSRYISEIPTIISQTETMIAREYKGLGTQNSVTANLEAGVSVIPLPVRWRETINFNYGQGATPLVAGTKRVSLRKRTLEYCREYWPDPSMTGAPKYYAEYTFGFHLIVPTPVVAFPFELLFYERPQPLDAQNSQNWFTANAPDLLFKGCMLWASRYLRAGEIGVNYQQDYDRALASSMGEDVARMMGDGSSDAKKGD